MNNEVSYNLDLSRDSKWNMVSATPGSRTSLLYLQEVGDFIAGPKYYTTRCGFDSFLIKLCVSGEGILTYGGVKYTIKSGMFYWIDCENFQDYRTSPDSGQWHVMWVHFNGPSARFYYDTFIAGNSSPVGKLPFDSGAYSILQTLLDISTNPPIQQETDLLAASLLSQLLTECIMSSYHISDSKTVPDYVRDVQLYIEEHYKDRITLDTLGAFSSTNPFYLQKQFKKHIGMSPLDYLNYLRLTKAKKLMRTTHMSIGDIASEVGIDNHNYFTRLFREHENMTPMNYRKLWPILEKKNDEQSSFYLNKE